MGHQKRHLVPGQWDDLHTLEIVLDGIHDLRNPVRPDSQVVAVIDGYDEGRGSICGPQCRCFSFFAMSAPDDKGSSDKTHDETQKAFLHHDCDLLRLFIHSGHLTPPPLVLSSPVNAPTRPRSWLRPRAPPTTRAAAEPLRAAPPPARPLGGVRDCFPCAAASATVAPSTSPGRGA